MSNQANPVSKKRRIGTAVIILLCVIVATIVAAVLLLIYEPNRNALGALGTVCMDVLSMAVLIIMVLSLVLDNKDMNHTTKLFLCLMLGTIWALLMDFLTWSFDGLLEYGSWTFVFTVLSLCTGSLLAGFFSLYLSCYMNDMYDMKGQFRDAKVCAALNVFSFVITLALAFTRTAFDFVDGHYETGALYDIITVIPILTLIYMTIYAIRHIKIIGAHDVIAVAGYILTMVVGVIIETEYRVGATYVSVAIADIFIFIMLQNKLIDRVKKQREILAERITSQYEILESMSRIYSHVNYIDLEAKTVRRIDIQGSAGEKLDISVQSHSSLNKKLYEGIEDELKDNFWSYTDLTTLNDRMAGEKLITAEFCHKNDGWFRAQYIRIGDNVSEPLRKIIYAIRDIDEEKKNVEKWIRKSNTDELTGFFNRHAYEDEIVALEGSRIKDNFVYISIDVNSLKIVNDSFGHEAGDELLVGACECLKQCFGSYGKLFRTGGDEFVALIYADAAQLEELKKDFTDVTENWKGRLINELAVSCGYVTAKEAENMTIRQMAGLADKRMYDDKSRYYQKRGIDRRGQRDAHVALCALYTKILKINVTDDTYQIINMDDSERTEDKGFSEKLSQWIYDFGASGHVHPDDLEEYQTRTSIEYISNHFRNNKNTLLVFYRRKFSDGYKKVMMEIIPANDYMDESQNLFLYVKNIEQ